jgi:subtilisin family serine protease
MLLALESSGSVPAGRVVKRDPVGVTFLTRQLAVKFKDGTGDGRAESYARRWGLSILRRVPYAGAAYAMRWDRPAGRGLLERATEAARDKDVVYAEPILAGTSAPDQPAAPGGLLYGLQWHLRQIRCPEAWDALRQALGANRAFGDPDIVVAVMDGGVDLTNGDLGGVVSDGQAKLHEAFDFSRMVGNNDVRHDAGHGTRCAGIAVARGDNGGGVMGAAANCRLMALRTPGVAPSPVASELDFADAYVWAAGLDPQSGKPGFPAPLQRGADIISSSFAGPTKDLPISGLMQSTFDRLTDTGRNGRGTLLFFSSGTFFGTGEPKDLTLRRPWAAYERTFAVGAATLADDGATEIHPDYSGHGGLSLLDLCAPSHDGGNPAAFDAPGRYATVTSDEVGRGDAPRTAVARTTLTADAQPGLPITTLAVADNTGFPLYGWALLDVDELTRAELVRIVGVPSGDPTVLRIRDMREEHPARASVVHGPTDCTLAFGGTSSAAPLCAGGAALVLAAKPDMTWLEVRDLLRRTAARIDPANLDSVGAWVDASGRRQGDAGYAGPLYSRWYGFGRLDAAAAVQQALLAPLPPS